VERTATLEEAMQIANRLPPQEKAYLIARLIPSIERDLQLARNTPRKSLRGLWRGLDTTEEELAEARREMWKTFPRGEI